MTSASEGERQDYTDDVFINSYIIPRTLLTYNNNQSDDLTRLPILNWSFPTTAVGTPNNETPQLAYPENEIPIPIIVPTTKQ